MGVGRWELRFLLIEHVQTLVQCAFLHRELL